MSTDSDQNQNLIGLMKQKVSLYIFTIQPYGPTFVYIPITQEIFPSRWSRYTFTSIALSRRRFSAFGSVFCRTCSLDPSDSPAHRRSQLIHRRQYAANLLPTQPYPVRAQFMRIAYTVWYASTEISRLAAT